MLLSFVDIGTVYQLETRESVLFDIPGVVEMLLLFVDI